MKESARAVAKIYVKDGYIEAALLHFLQPPGHAVAGTGERMAQHIDEILDHHGDERLILNDEDGQGYSHIARHTGPKRMRLDRFGARNEMEQTREPRACSKSLTRPVPAVRASDTSWR